jgi:hypothetical protein
MAKKITTKTTPTATLVGELVGKIAEQAGHIKNLERKLEAIYTLIEIRDRHTDDDETDVIAVRMIRDVLGCYSKPTPANISVAEDGEVVLDLSNPNGEWNPVEMWPEGRPNRR